MMKEFTGGGLIRQERYFGLRLCQARMVIECAFGKLKARFGILRRALDTTSRMFPNWFTPALFYIFFVKSYCESVSEEQVNKAIPYDQQFQPSPSPLREYNNAEGKIVRQIVA